MTDFDLQVRRTDTAAKPAIIELLEAAGLPTYGVAEDETTILLTVLRGDQVVGSAAVERYEPDGLLRSVVVTPAEQGRGIGRALVTAAEVAARSDGLGALFLLTEDAVGFFATLGYRSLHRRDVPLGIRGSDEYAVVCPEGATVMVKRLNV